MEKIETTSYENCASFLKVPYALIIDRRMTGKHWSVWYAIALYDRDEDRDDEDRDLDDIGCKASVAELVACSGLSESAYYRYENDLIAWRYLIKVPYKKLNRKGVEQNMPNRILTIPKEKEKRAKSHFNYMQRNIDYFDL